MNMLLKKLDDELQVVYGEVYAPNVPDAQGDFMTSDEVIKMAHEYMKNGSLTAVDTNHDNKETGSTVVESFIANEGDPIFVEGAWVVGIHVPDPELWAGIKNGELNGFSMEAMVQAEKKIIEFEVPDIIVGTTLSDDTGHTHEYTVKFDEQGNFLGGSTDVVDGHVHPIVKATVTGETEGHTHKFSIVESMEELEIA